MTAGSLVLPITALTRVSPSRYFSMQLCSLKEIWLSNRQGLLLPLSPLVRLGSISHKVLQYATQGQIVDVDSFNSCWDSQVRSTESEMLKNQIERHLVPLEKYTVKYEVKKYMVFKLVQSLIVSVKGVSKETQRKPELWVDTEDGKVAGRIDLAIQHNGEVELIDYKTGNIEDGLGSGILKQEYQLQMKLYAALYFEKYNVWPTHLSLVGIDQKKYEVNFEQDECSGLLEKAKKSIAEINELIQSGLEPGDFANPSPSVCIYCSFRPACRKYWESKDGSGGWPLDISGEIKEKER